MRTVAIVQARMGSTRLPGKVLVDLHGKPVLQRVIERLRRCARLHDVVIATSVAPGDDRVAEAAAALSAAVFRGSEDDVLARYAGAARACGAEVAVRITADCPLLDPGVVDRVIAAREDGGLDYASSFLPRTFPRGLDAEAFTVETLFAIEREATLPYERAHVTPFYYQHPERFRIGGVAHERDESRHRWTLDTPEDLRLIRELLARVPDRDGYSFRDLLAVVAREPALAEINAAIEQKKLEQG